jgi:hypothetical protein
MVLIPFSETQARKSQGEALAGRRGGRAAGHASARDAEISMYGKCDATIEEALSDRRTFIQLLYFLGIRGFFS